MLNDEDKEARVKELERDKRIAQKLCLNGEWVYTEAERVVRNEVYRTGEAVDRIMKEEELRRTFLDGSWEKVAEHMELDGLQPDVLRDELQSKRPYRCDLLDAHAVLRLANIMHLGLQTHEPEGWRQVSVVDHLGHALTHIFAHMSHDVSNDHLGHAFARLMFAVALAGPPGTPTNTRGGQNGLCSKV